MIGKQDERPRRRKVAGRFFLGAVSEGAQASTTWR